MQEKILIVKEERRFLLKKLYHLQAIAGTWYTYYVYLILHSNVKQESTW